MYQRKVGDDNPKVRNKTCIMAQVDALQPKLCNTRVIIFAHKEKVDPKKTSHR